MGRLTTFDFIERARQVHYDKYDYSQVKYVNNSTKVRIICPEHGEFDQTPGNHWAGKKCSKCAAIQRAKKKTKTTEQFIEEAWDVHGDFYDYALVEYAGQSSEVKIICPVHGEFLQKPKIHLRGNGCTECGFETIIRKKTKNKGYFITKARQAHGDRYDYSEVEYQGAEKNVTIICQLHGKFLQSPGNHYAGKGCPACSGLARYDNIRFIEKARRAHGDKYDYSNVNVVNGHTKVEIICPNHGKFSQEVRHHVRGVGCPECKKVSISEALTKSTDDFISEARVIHGDSYNYAKVDYITGRDDVTIICPVHGEFQQQPRAHLQESGCPKCGDFIGADVRRKTTEQFVTDAIKTHKNKYDYSLVEYRGAFEKVKIICPEHGVFEQFAGGHIGGSNCPSCAYTGFDYNAPTILYYLRVETRNQLAYKIGVTNNSVEERFTRPDLEKITTVKLFHFDTGQEAYDREQEILAEYAAYRFAGDPLLITGNTELFNHDVLRLDDRISGD